jgi:hypothetical protein
MRSLVLAAAAALVFASVAGAATSSYAASAVPPGPYTLDAKGNCHAKNGQLVAKTNCAAPHLLSSTLTTTTTTGAAPHCDPAKSIPCGNSCIAKGKVCHH